MPLADKPVAIIGMGCFFPKSSNLQEYWKLLLQGQDAITVVPDTHWAVNDYFDPDPKAPDHVYCKRGGFISPVQFDPMEFGIPPSALEATDTSQLLALLAAKRALADAGYGEGRSFDRERTSVILGVTGTQELVIPLSTRLGHPVWRKALTVAGISAEKIDEIIRSISDSYVSWQENSFPGLLGNVVAGRICNRLNLGGTNCVVDAACASSMSAIHLALMELLSGRSDMVITGGVDTLNDIFMHMCFAKTQVLSPTGDARPFSRYADGTVLGEGVGLLILKRLADAEKDGDRIYAVIRGLGSSSDGKSQSIYAPRAEGQAKALRRAYASTGIEPATVELVEAHGTGTKVGDRVEFEALKQVFSESAGEARRCALGSVKSMIGHTKAAAGAAGLIKAALALHNKILPPTLKAEEPDPDLNLPESPFYLNTSSRPWTSNGNHPRRAGVSAFGFGGSNFHVVLEEHRPGKQEPSWDGAIEIFAVSSPTLPQLLSRLKELKEEIREDSSNHELIAAAAARSRQAFSASDRHRFLAVFDRSHETPEGVSERIARAMEMLSARCGEAEGAAAADLPGLYYGDTGSETPPGKIAFVFPGQGSQYTAMGRDLICCFPEALAMLETADKKFCGSGRLSEMIYPAAGLSGDERVSREDVLRRTENSQPAIGAVSLGLLGVLRRFALKPDAACGHSFGELSALCAAGWIDAETLMDLAVARGRFMAAAAGCNGAAQPAGAMLAVAAPLAEIEKLAAALPPLVLANRNSPEQGVLSRPADSIAAAEKNCRELGFKTLRLPVGAAFHSHLVAHAQGPFRQFLESVRISPTDIPVYSNTTGRPYSADAETARELIAGQILHPVDFVTEIENLYGAGIRTFIEIGPKSVMSGLIRSILKGRNARVLAMDASAGKRSGMADLAGTLCSLAAAGYPVALRRWEKEGAVPVRARMPVVVLGANFKPRTTEKASVAAPRKRSHPDDRTISAQVKSETVIPMSVKPEHLDKDRQKDTAFVGDAFRMLQEGLRSMQALQGQTAAAHQKFLETQAEAGRVLQKMMESARRIGEAALGLSPAAETAARRQAETTGSADRSAGAAIGPEPEKSSGYITGGKRETIRTPEKAAPAAVPEKNQEPLSPAVVPVQADPAAVDLRADESNFAKAQTDIENALLAVVSDLTGYPQEMLGLDMDIEADLGIDSIKRVEILSTLEERVPGLPAVAPELMGRLKTLSQIIAHFSAGHTPEESSPTGGATVSTVVFSPKQRPNPKPAGGLEGIEAVLLAVVGELTGYPPEMLGLDMDIEADLGIDSIKRVEILSTLEERMPGLPAVAPELMGRLKTLSQIIAHFSDAGGHDPENPEATEASSKAEAAPQLPEPAAESACGQARKIITAVTSPLQATAEAALPAGSRIYITEDGSGLSQALAGVLSRRGFETVLLAPGDLKRDASGAKAAGLIVVAGAGIDLQAPEILDRFFLVQSLADELIVSAGQSAAFFATITRLDGAFGFYGKGVQTPLQGCLAGLAKTAALEWKGVRCRALDIDPGWQRNEEIAAAAAVEILNADPSGAIEVGLSAERRCTLELCSDPYPPQAQQVIDLGPADVVVVSGGARGITAVAAKALAVRNRPILVLLGRSPLPAPEPEWLRQESEEASIKKAIIAHEFSGRRPSPVQVEKRFRRYLAGREIADTLRELREAGAAVHYYSVDIRLPEKVLQIFDRIGSAHGQVTAVIHGAGVLEDRLIVDKTRRQFTRVFDTKVRGLQNILAAVAGAPLKYLVLFSSVAGRMGNRGQADYAMANEALNKIAQQQAAVRVGCRVVSINWGPWEGGMVSGSMKRELQRNRIPLIPLEAGARNLLTEMAGSADGAVEVVVGAELKAAAAAEPAAGSAALALTLKREVDVDTVPILAAHILDGKPVVPFALMAEWFGHGALHENPGLSLFGLDDMRLLKGIRLDRQKRLIRLFAGKARRDRSSYTVDVELRDGMKNDVDVIHSRAKAILTESFDPPPSYEIPAALSAGNYARSRDELYEKILFHGDGLRGIRQIFSCSPGGMLARLATAPPPDQWMKAPFRSRWIADPLVLDGAFQMATVWCFEQKGFVSLPSYYARYRQHRLNFPEGDVTAVLEVTEAGDHKMKGDFTFLDKDGIVIAQVRGYEAVMDVSLLKAFKRQPSADE